MKTILFSGAVALALLTGNAFAADAVVIDRSSEVPVVQTVHDWSGAYIKGSAGYGWGKSDHEHQNVNTFGGPGGTYGNSGNGFVGGGAVGYNVQLPNKVVLGVEGAIRSGQNMDDGGKWEIYHNSTSTKSRYVTSVTGKVGYAAGRWLPYVKGGWAGANVVSGQDYHPGGGIAPTTWHDGQFLSGYTVGVGVDYAVTDKMFVGLEYDFTDFGKHTFSGNDSNGNPTKISGNLRDHTIMASVGFKF